MTDGAGALDADQDVYRTLLESTKAIPWKIDWSTTRFTYIGPQIESLLGWSQASWLGVEDWAARIHEEDRERVVNFCVSQSQAGIDHEADYRALKPDGSYVWIRDVVHVVRNEAGEVQALVGFMFDINARKHTEDRLLQLQRELEALSYQDGLTGIANRRRFDSVIEAEWAQACSTGRPLSLILADIDDFKQYNDRYGHLQGDDCLRRVASVLRQAIGRSGDFVARYGGEEFVLVLPDTDAAAAAAIAEGCRASLQAESIAHEAASAGALLTLSLGIGTALPVTERAWHGFVDRIDALLYEAKRQGRDRAVCADFGRL